MLHLSQIAQSYKQACAEIKSLIKRSSFKITHIIEEFGLSQGAFYSRLKAENWEPEHLLMFANIFSKCPKLRGAANTTSAN